MPSAVLRARCRAAIRLRDTTSTFIDRSQHSRQNRRPEMNDHSRRGRSHRTFALPPSWRWLTVTVLAIGGGGTTAAILIQEEALTLESLGPVAAIPLLGAPILW